jgi:predicted RNA polymerase sigma factor
MVQPLNEARARVAELVRGCYGRLLAVLAAPNADIAAAEDALGDALERALARWPNEGIPANPEAWVLTVARNRLRDRWKSHGYRKTGRLPETWDVSDDSPDPAAMPERRLELMLVCAHPAIAANCRTALMLQTVLGIDSAAIARAFSLPPATLAQRLVRAKRRIREARVPSLPARTSTSGCRPCWRPSTVRGRSIGSSSRPVRRSNRWPPRRCIWHSCWPSCCPRSPRRLGWRR